MIVIIHHPFVQSEIETQLADARLHEQAPDELVEFCELNRRVFVQERQVVRMIVRSDCDSASAQAEDQDSIVRFLDRMKPSWYVMILTVDVATSIDYDWRTRDKDVEGFSKKFSCC